MSRIADFSYMCICVYISVIRRSVNVGSYSFKTIRARRVHARTDRILERTRAHGQVINAT